MLCCTQSQNLSFIRLSNNTCVISALLSPNKLLLPKHTPLIQTRMNFRSLYHQADKDNAFSIVYTLTLGFIVFSSIKMTPERVKWQNQSRHHLTLYILIYQLQCFPQHQDQGEADQHLLQGSRSLYFSMQNQFLRYCVFLNRPKLREMMPWSALQSDNRK